MKIKTIGIAGFLYIPLCAAGAFIALFFFWNDINQTLIRQNETPIGTVRYKYRAVQRRFSDRLLWDRLRQESPVYNGDLIRTAELSEAAVRFVSDGGNIEILENSLIRITRGRNGTRIDLNEGSLLAEIQDGRMSIESGGAVLSGEEGSVISVRAAEGGPDIQVHEGNVGITEGGSRRSAGEGERIGAAGPAHAARLALLSPRPQAKFLNNSEGPLAVRFTWNKINFASGETVRLEIAGDRNFTRTIQTIESNGNEAKVELAKGVYYWRAYPAGQAAVAVKWGGISGRLQIIHAPAPVLISPVEGEGFRFRTTRPGIRFQWTACEEAAAYVVEVSMEEDMTNIVYATQVQRTGDDTGTAVFYGFEPGPYFWRVRPVYPQGFEGRAAQSLNAFFRIEKAEKLAAPQTRERRETIYLEGREKSIYFSWNQENDAAYYTFLLSKQQNLNNPVIKEQVKDNYYALDIQNANLASGEYYWGVYQTSIEGNSSPVSASQRLIIVAGAPPKQPLVVPGPEVTVAVQPVEEPLPKIAAAVQPVEEPLPEIEAAVQPVEEPLPEIAAAVQPVEKAPPAGIAAIPETREVPLAAPGLTLPRHEEIFTEERIIQDRAITFSWNAVPGARAYELAIYHVTFQGTQEVFRTTVRNALSYTLTDLTVLDRGQFRWQVRALDETRRGSPAERVFAVDMGNYEAAEGNESGVIFGN
jgi:hypothetical protein